MTRKRYLLASDIHQCHIEWYGVTTEERMDRFCRHIEEEYKKEPFEALLLLGDYSLDFWKWDIQGCYIKEGKSNTKIFADKVLRRLEKLGVKMAVTAGNHEQYGEKLWNEITGYNRRDCVVCDDCVFIVLDTYGADLDPTEHSDGTYCNADTAYIKKIADTYPNHKIILCAHYFDAENESDEFKTLVRENERILCLIHGHVHKSDVIELGEKFGNKALLCTGNYSYGEEKNGAVTPMWGFRDLILTDDTLISRYITPENDIALDGKTVHRPYGFQDEYTLE